jgi:hypothetical protein
MQHPNRRLLSRKPLPVTQQAEATLNETVAHLAAIAGDLAELVAQLRDARSASEQPDASASSPAKKGKG